MIRVAGWAASGDNHETMRILENLARLIDSIPPADRSWGIDVEPLGAGLNELSERAPGLWSQHGRAIERAVERVPDQ